MCCYLGIYHAAQIGITHSGKDHAANLFLGKLLDVLERMKKDLASHDAIRDENVASAYVENFALKIMRYEEPTEQDEAEAGRPFIGSDGESRGSARSGESDKVLAADIGCEE